MREGAERSPDPGPQCPPRALGAAGGKGRG